MIRRPRKRGPSIREQIRPELANAEIDDGEYGPDAKPEGAAEPSALLGRPAVHDWFRIAVEMCWQLSSEGEWRKLKRDDFLKNMQAWCKDELGVKPSEDELKRRIGLVRKRFPRR